MTGRQINFVRAPTEFEYGTVAVFEDLYGIGGTLLNRMSKIMV